MEVIREIPIGGTLSQDLMKGRILKNRNKEKNCMWVEKNRKCRLYVQTWWKRDTKCQLVVHLVRNGNRGRWKMWIRRLS